MFLNDEVLRLLRVTTGTKQMCKGKKKVGGNKRGRAMEHLVYWLKEHGVDASVRVGGNDHYQLWMSRTVTEDGVPKTTLAPALFMPSTPSTGRDKERQRIVRTGRASFGIEMKDDVFPILMLVW